MFVQHGSDRNSPGFTGRYFQKLGSALFVVLDGGFPLAFHLWMGKNYVAKRCILCGTEGEGQIPNQLIINVMFRSSNPIYLTLNQIVFLYELLKF